MSRNLSQRERWLLREALLLLEEADQEDAVEDQENAESSEEADKEKEAPKEISEASPEQMAEMLEDKLAKSSLPDTVDFLNAAMTSNPESMKTVLLDPKYSGKGDGPWEFNGDIGEDGTDEQGNTKYKVTGGTAVPISQIVATQNTIDLQKSVGWAMSSPQSLEWLYSNPNSTYSDFRGEPIAAMKAGKGKIYVLDGHHRWSAQGCMKGPSGQISAALLTIPGTTDGGNNEQDFLKACQMGIAAYVMRTTPEKAAKKGLPSAPGGDPGDISKEGGPFEILENPPKISANWDVQFGKTCHDSKQTLGGAAWWAALARLDRDLKVPWLNGFSPDDSVKDSMRKIADAFEGVEERPKFKSQKFEKKPKKNTDEYKEYEAEEKEWETEVYGPWLETAKDSFKGLDVDAKAIWKVFGDAFQSNWEKITPEGMPGQNASRREVMPQFGGDKTSYETQGGLGGMLTQAAKDPGNYGAPYTNESIDLARWGKLAGLLND